MSNVLNVVFHVNSPINHLQNGHVGNMIKEESNGMVRFSERPLADLGTLHRMVSLVPMAMYSTQPSGPIVMKSILEPMLSYYPQTFPLFSYPTHPHYPGSSPFNITPYIQQVSVPTVNTMEVLKQKFNNVKLVIWIDSTGRVYTSRKITKSELNPEDFTAIEQYVACYVNSLNNLRVGKKPNYLHYWDEYACNVLPIGSGKTKLICVNDADFGKVVAIDKIDKEYKVLPIHVLMGDCIAHYTLEEVVNAIVNNTPVVILPNSINEPCPYNPKVAPVVQQTAPNSMGGEVPKPIDKDNAEWPSTPEEYIIPETMSGEEHELGFKPVIAAFFSDVSDTTRGKNMGNETGTSVIPGYSIKETEEEIIIITNKPVVVKRK